jgi:hypothetical protein
MPKPYLYIEELAEFVPWSIEAIRKKVQRGELRLGVHYFQDRHRARLIFKWASIVELIEAGGIKANLKAWRSGVGRREPIGIERAIEELNRLALSEAVPGAELVRDPPRRKRK